jgi:hypothetical protein
VAKKVLNAPKIIPDEVIEDSPLLGGLFGEEEEAKEEIKIFSELA